MLGPDQQQYWMQQQQQQQPQQQSSRSTDSYGRNGGYGDSAYGRGNSNQRNSRNSYGQKVSSKDAFKCLDSAINVLSI